MKPETRRALVAAAALLACMPAAPQSFLEKAQKALQEAAAKAQQQQQPQQPQQLTPQQLQQQQLQQQQQQLQQRAQQRPGAVPPGYTRTHDALRALLARGQVPGDELINELKAMRLAMRRNRTEASIAALAGGVDKSGGSQSKQDLGEILKKQAQAQLMRQIEDKAKDLSGRLSFSALDGGLDSLGSNPSLLSKETVKLPSPDGLAPPLMQRAVTMAAMVVAVRATRKMYEQAQHELAGVDDEYKTLIDRREKAAALLYEAVTARAQAQRDGNAKALREADSSLLRTMSADEKAFLEADLSRLDAANFVNDIAAQNLAIRFLRERDPSAYADYSARRDGTLKRTKGFLYTAGGAAAIGGLAALFVREVRKAAEEVPSKQLVPLVPLIGEFVNESFSLVRLAADTTGSAFSSAVQSGQRFRIVTAGGELPARDAAAVFEAFKGKDAERLLSESLFRNGSPGLLQRVHTCDRAEAGRMIDSVVDRRERERFAGAYFGSNRPSDSFQFVNAFAPLPLDDDAADEAKQSAGRLHELGDRLLRADYRGERDEAVMPLGALQERVAANATKWNTEQLMRLIFANREGAASMATLQLGDISVRPVPSPESIFVYESLIDACKSLVAPTAPPPKPTAPAKPPRQGRT